MLQHKLIKFSICRQNNINDKTMIYGLNFSLEAPPRTQYLKINNVRPQMH